MSMQTYSTKSKSAAHRAWRSVIVLLLIAAMALPLLTGCGKKDPNLEVVGTCAGYDIPYEELRFVTHTYRKIMESEHGADIWKTGASASKYAAELKVRVLNNLNSTYAVYALCDHLGVDIDSKEVNEYVDKQIATLKTSEFKDNNQAFEAFLAENYMTENLLRQSVRTSYLESLALYAMIGQKQYVSYSTSNLDEFMYYVENSPKYARTLHIYLANEDGRTAPTDKALEEAQAIYEELAACQDADARFDALCQMISAGKSDDYDMLTTDGYYFTEHEMKEAYEGATFNLDIGEVSEPVITDDGVYVIMRLKPESAYIMTNLTELLDNYHSAALTRQIELFREQNSATLNDYGNSLNLWEID